MKTKLCNEGEYFKTANIECLVKSYRYPEKAAKWIQAYDLDSAADCIRIEQLYS